MKELVELLLSEQYENWNLAKGIIVNTKFIIKTYEKLDQLNLSIGNYDVDKGQPGYRLEWVEAVIGNHIHFRTARRVKRILDILGITPEYVYIGRKPGQNKSTYVTAKYKNEPIILAQRQTDSMAAGQFYLYSSYKKSGKGARLGKDNSNIFAPKSTKEEILNYLEITI